MQAKKKSVAVLAFIFLFMYVLNHYTAVYFGDDMIYPFKWKPGIPFYSQPYYDTERLSSFGDILRNVYYHYYDWHGRLTGAFFMFFAGWTEKDVFNVCNALMTTALTFLVGRIAYMGKLSDISWKTYVLATALFWALFQGWAEGFLWISGSTSYLWTTVIILLFSYPFIHAFYQPTQPYAKWMTGLMLPFGIIAGATNEMSIPTVTIGCALVILYLRRKQLTVPHWMYTGLIGLTAGYLIMMLSPSTPIRIATEIKDMEDFLPYATKIPAWFPEFLERTKDGKVMGWLFGSFIKNNIISYCVNFISGLCLLGVNFVLLKTNKDVMRKEDYYLCGFLIFAGFFSSFLMIFSISLPSRSFFFSYTCIVISFLLLKRTYENTPYKFYRSFFKYACAICSVWFLLSGSVYTWHKTLEWEKWQDFDAYMKTRKGLRACYIYTPEYYPMEYLTSGKKVWFFSFYRLYRTENNRLEYKTEWIQETVKKYYGVKYLKLLINDINAK